MKIAIIGGSYLQLPLVLKAKKMGHEVHCFSWTDGAVCEKYSDYFYPISILEKEEILGHCKKIAIDGILSIASDAAVGTVNYIASELGLISNPVEFTEMTTDKYSMREQLHKYGLPCPKFTSVNEGRYDLTDFKYPLIVKPTDRSGSRGVEIVSDSGHLQTSIKRAELESFTSSVIIEEYISGQEISVESISYQGKHHILQITDKITTGPPHFVELSHHQPSELPHNIQSKVKDVVLKALDALNIKYGASHSELKITEDGDIFIIEIGARMGGDFIGSSLVRLSTGYDFLKGVIQVALGKFEEPVISKHNHSGVYFLSKETEYLKDIIRDKSKYPEIIETEIIDSELRYISNSSDRSGYIIYQGNSKVNFL